MRWFRCFSLVGLLIGVWAAPGWAQTPIDLTADVIRTLNLPNAVGEYDTTQLADMNAQGWIVGGFGFPIHGLPEGSFYLYPDGTAKLFTCGPDVAWTQVRGVNRHPAMVGWCFVRGEDSTTVYGFYRSESGKMTALRVPGATLTEANDVNDSHVVVGHYLDSAGRQHGFRWTRSTGRYETLDAPFPGTVHTAVLGINNAGDMVGITHGPAEPVRGFLVRQGVWRRLDKPGAAVTAAWAITDTGYILGLGDGLAQQQNILWHADTVQQLALPFPHLWGFTMQNMTSAGVILGTYTHAAPATDGPGDVAGSTHGFVAHLAALHIPAAPVFVAQAMRGHLKEAPPRPVGRGGIPPPHTGKGCPDDPRTEANVHRGRLAMSWALCERLLQAVQ
jgi:hypothetical protein